MRLIMSRYKEVNVAAGEVAFNGLTVGNDGRWFLLLSGEMACQLQVTTPPHPERAHPVPPLPAKPNHPRNSSLLSHTPAPHGLCAALCSAHRWQA